jgi:major vault protein
VRGPTTFLLGERQAFWSKPLNAATELLLSQQGYIPMSMDSAGSMKYEKKIGMIPRDKTKAVIYKAPHNSAVQLFDYKTKQPRIVFGPELIMLEPYEDFTVLSLSGGAPKQEN